MLQGCGRQSFGLKLNLVAFYLIGMPISLLCGFSLGWGVEGLMTGLITGAGVQCLSYLVYTYRFGWDKEAQRIFLANQEEPDFAVDLAKAPEGAADSDAAPART